MSILRADIGPWIRRVLIVGLCAAVMFSVAYFGPQLLRRSVDYVRKPAPPPESAHWLEHRAYFAGHLIDEDMGNLVGWHRHETVVDSDVTLELRESEPFSFRWSAWSSRHGVTTSFELGADGMVEFRTLPPSDWDVTESWAVEGECVALRFTMTLEERLEIARKLHDESFGDMPARYWLTGFMGGNQWRFEVEQNGQEKTVRCEDLFPRDCRALVEYILREVVLPRA